MAKKYVSNKDESARMFRSDFLEAFSHVHWTVPHIIFIPVILGTLHSALHLFHLGFAPGHSDAPA